MSCRHETASTAGAKGDALVKFLSALWQCFSDKQHCLCQPQNLLERQCTRPLPRWSWCWDLRSPASWHGSLWEATWTLFILWWNYNLLGVVAHNCGPSTHKAEVGWISARVWGHPGLHGRFQVSLSYRAKPTSNKQSMSFSYKSVVTLMKCILGVACGLPLGLWSK